MTLFSYVEALFESTILRGHKGWIEQLHDWLPSTLQNKEMKLCYRASVNGWASSTFHNLCDNKGPTVVLIESGQYVFGGFAAASWGGNHCLLLKLFHLFISIDWAGRQWVRRVHMNEVTYKPIKTSITANIDYSKHLLIHGHVAVYCTNKLLLSQKCICSIFQWNNYPRISSYQIISSVFI